jgi:hypothetical protein
VAFFGTNLCNSEEPYEACEAAEGKTYNDLRPTDPSWCWVDKTNSEPIYGKIEALLDVTSTTDLSNECGDTEEPFVHGDPNCRSSADVIDYKVFVGAFIGLEAFTDQTITEVEPSPPTPAPENDGTIEKKFFFFLLLFFIIFNLCRLIGWRFC